jgi:glycosyltransferase involved in cell wall biosynthesis
MKTISLFTPCYNEEGNIYELYQRVTEIMKSLPEYEYEYIFIDNCSLDNTPNILRKICNEDKRIKAIFNVRNFGPSRSGSYGFFQTTGDVSICLACDFQDPPELIPDFIKKWEEGYKVVWGKKTDSEESKFMYHVRNLYYKIISTFAEVKQYEQVTGFGLYDKEVMNFMKNANDPNPNFRNLVADLGYEIGMVEYHQPMRKKGKSSYNFFSYLNTAISALVNTSKAPLRIASYLGGVGSIFSFLLGMVYLILKLVFWNSFFIGVAPIAIGVFFLGSIQLLCMGILGEYIGEILTRLIKRPLVVEKDRINFEESSKEK